MAYYLLPLYLPDRSRACLSRRRNPISIFRALCFACLLLLVGSFPYAQPLNNFTPGPEPDGFRGISWGTDLATLNHMKYFRTDPSYGGIGIYLRAGDEVRFGDMVFEHVEYLFWRGKFAGIFIFSEGISNFLCLRGEITSRFGSGKKSVQNQDYIVWDGQVILITLDYSSVSGLVVFGMISKSILSLMEANNDPPR